MNIAKISIEYLELPTRALTVFIHVGISTIGQIENKTDNELRRLPGMGPGTLLAVRQCVNDFRERCHRFGFDQIIFRGIPSER